MEMQELTQSEMIEIEGGSLAYDLGHATGRALCVIGVLLLFL